MNREEKELKLKIFENLLRAMLVERPGKEIYVDSVIDASEKVFQWIDLGKISEKPTAKSL